MRSLTTELGNLQDQEIRLPAFEVLVYDIRSTRSFPAPDTMSRVVQGAVLAAETGPLDITDFVERVTLAERDSDIVSGTIRGNSIAFNLIDRGNRFDPVDGSEKRWLQAGNIVRVKAGDASIDPSVWPFVFTGTLIGRAAAGPKNRNNEAQLSLTAEDRSAQLLKTTITTQDFPQGTPLGDIIRAILEDELGFGASEFDLGTIGQSLSDHRSLQIVDEDPMTAIAKLAFIDGFVPRFQGDGSLAFLNTTQAKGSSVFFLSLNAFQAFERPASLLECPNEVEIVGLSSELTKISQPPQVVATAGLTLGFFAGDARIQISFSSDKTQQVDNPRLNVVESVTGALIPFGSEEATFDVDDDGGSRTGRIDVGGAFYAPLVTTLFASRVAASFIPDTFAGFGGGSTIPVGRIVEGVASLANGLILGTIGRGDYEIVGEPFEWVFEEIREIAKVKDIRIEDRRRITFENHLVSTQAQAEAIALRELRTIRKRGNVWSCAMRHDLRLEAGDKFTLPDAREFVITDIEWTMERDAGQSARLTLYETTLGVNP